MWTQKFPLIENSRNYFPIKFQKVAAKLPSESVSLEKKERRSGSCYFFLYSPFLMTSTVYTAHWIVQSTGLTEVRNQSYLDREKQTCRLDI